MPIAELVNATWGDGSELPIINSEGLVIDEKKPLKGGTRTETQVIHEDKATPMPVQSVCHTVHIPTLRHQTEAGSFPCGAF